MTEWDPLLLIDEVADRLRVNRRAALTLAAAGAFPGAFRINGRGEYRIPESGLQAYISAQQAQEAPTVPVPDDGRARRGGPRVRPSIGDQ